MPFPSAIYICQEMTPMVTDFGMPHLALLKVDITRFDIFNGFSAMSVCRIFFISHQFISKWSVLF